MKQSERIIRKGDYYEIEVVEDSFNTNKTTRKEESQSNIQQNSENIIADLPTFQTARSNYYYQNKLPYDRAQPDELLHQLEDILNQEKLADEDKQEIIKLIRQVKSLKEDPLVPLTELTVEKAKESGSAKLHNVQLKVRVELGDLQTRLAQLEKFSYPDISKLEHQMEVLLGEKKPTSASSQTKDDRNKQDIENLFALFNGLKSANDLPGIIDRVHGSNGKYVQMANWAANVENTLIFHSDFLAELKEDEKLLDKLEQNFKNNVATVKEIVGKLKEGK